MATVSNTIALQDKMTPVLSAILKSLDSTMVAMAGVDKVSDRAFKKAQSDVQQANSALEQFNNTAAETPEIVNKSSSAFGNLKTNVIAINQALELGKKVVTAIADKLTEVSALTDLQSRLRATLGENEDIYVMQEMIQKSAMGTRSSYADTLDSVVRMKGALEEYGATSEDALRLSELMNKSLTLGGTKGQAAASVMYNLNQSLSSGRLKWEDWKIISANSFYLSKTIADNLGVTKAELDELVQKGQVSAADFANALIESGEKIDSEFEAMPDTFADWMMNIQTFATGEFLSEGGLHDKILQLLGSESFMMMVDEMKNAIVIMFDALGVVLDYVIIISDFIGEHWGIIEPILWGVIGALTVLSIVMIASAIATWIANSATIALTISLLANPLTRIVILIVGVIVAILSFIKRVGGLQNAWEIAKAAILIALLGLKLGFFTAIYFVLNLVDKLKLGWQKAGVAIANFVGDMKVKVLMGLEGMINGAIDIINKFIGVLNKIPGVSIDTISNVTFGTTAKLENEAAKQARADSIKEAENKMAQAVAERDEKLQGMKDELSGSVDNLKTLYAESKSGAEKTAEEKAEDKELKGNKLEVDGGDLDTVGKIKDDVSITDDDIKYLKDIASTEFVNRYTTLRPEMTVSFGDVRETADVEKILDAFETMIEEAYASSLVGGVT